MITEQIVERIRAAAEELTGLPSVPSPDAPAPSVPAPRRVMLAVSAASIVALLVGLIVLEAGRRDEAPSGPDPTWSSMVVDDTVGAWLDLADVPAGLRRSVNVDLAATTVCLTSTVSDEQLRCAALEGQIASVYVPSSAPLNADETLNEIEIRTVFIEVGVEEFTRHVTPDAATEMTQVKVRGHDGYSVVDNETGATVVVWSDRPGTINTIRTATKSGLDPIELAGSLESRLWPPDVRPPLVAVDFSLGWRAFDSNHPYALATERGVDECVSVGFVRPSYPGDEGLTACTNGPAVWTIGSVTDHTEPGQSGLSERDVIAGLVPASVTSVQLQLEDGRLIQIPTLHVTGLRHRTFGLPTDSPQGALVVGELTGFAGNVEVFSEHVVAMTHTVEVDTVCSAPGATHVIPDVVGIDLRAAQQALRQAGLLVALPVAVDTMPIATQAPPAGSDLGGCGEVVLTFEP